MDDSRKIIGIDFGSSQSSISILKIGTAEDPSLIPTSSGRNGVTIPTVLLVDANDSSDVIAWGNEVSQRYKQKQDTDVVFVDNFKRYLGVDSTARPADKKKADLFCKLFIQKLAEKVREYENVDKLLTKDYATCFAYPATWNDDQISLLKKYAKEAGFPADPEFGIYAIPEPVAAMYALKVQGAAPNFSFGSHPENFMVIDFGGGTLDICVVRTGILGDHPRIVPTSGDPNLGGHDFDNIIAKLFFNEYPKVQKDLPEEERAELCDRFREAKEIYSDNFELSDTATYTFHIARGDYHLKVDKTTFENHCRSSKIFEKIQTSIDKALDGAGLTCADIKKVILTGGSSKWYFIRQMIAEKFNLTGNDICLTASPFTDVAKGCAVSKAWPNDPPLRPGVWIKVWIDGKLQNNVPKCILEPSKSSQGAVGEFTYIGMISETRYLTPYEIKIAFLSGFSEDKLKQLDKFAIIRFYARSNMPFLDSIRGGIKGIRHMHNDPLEDRYKIFIKCEDTDAMTKEYSFKIYDSEASKYEEVLRNQGEAEAQKYPRGQIEEGDLVLNNVSSRSWFGFSSRKKKQISR